MIPLQGTQVWYLIGELRSHMPHNMVKKTLYVIAYKVGSTLLECPLYLMVSCKFFLILKQSIIVKHRTFKKTSFYRVFLWLPFLDTLPTHTQVFTFLCYDQQFGGLAWEIYVEQQGSPQVIQTPPHGNLSDVYTPSVTRPPPSALILYDHQSPISPMPDLFVYALIYGLLQL